MHKTVSFLKQIHIFSSLDDVEIKILAKNLKLVPVKSGAVFCREGEEGHELYILKTGKITGTIGLPDGKQKEIVVFNPGDFFGEMSIFENAPRSATCYAKEKGSLFKLHKHKFFKIIESNPAIAIKVMYKMLNITTQRLRKTGSLVSDMVRWGDEASRRAITDELTGAYNRRFLDNSLDDYVEAARTSGKRLCLIMADLDYFRQINEAYGHQMGDKAILEAVAVFKHHLRQRDILARYGGDEFTVILPDTTMEEAGEIAEKIRRDVEKLDFLQSMNGPVKSFSASQGIACYPDTAGDEKALKKKADEALYAAKEAGRNRVYCAKSG
ncbi:MAG: GGDEF domain-containing protein [Spirochaetales bacterium]|nr:GGDEF domain-containing protein [Spirochaetales bacterium]